LGGTRSENKINSTKIAEKALIKRNIFPPFPRENNNQIPEPETQRAVRRRLVLIPNIGININIGKKEPLMLPIVLTA
jgi:hypothetical protein